MTAIEQTTIVALLALPEEQLVFQETFPYVEDCSIGRRICLVHNSGHEDIRLISVLAEQMGAQSAADSAALAIQHFSPNLVVVLGIAGGISKDVTVGDVCVSNEVIEILHNNKVSPKRGAADVDFSPTFFHVDPDLVASFTFLTAHPALKSLLDDWLDGTVKVAAERQPAFLVGPIVCGPVSANKKFNDKIVKLHRKILALETESGGVFPKSIAAGVPAIAIRGISDLADENKLSLESASKGEARRAAMRNAALLLRAQLNNPRFTNVAKRHLARDRASQAELFGGSTPAESLLATIHDDIIRRLKDVSPEFRNRSGDIYLPTPRMRKIQGAPDIFETEGDGPIELVEGLRTSDRIFLRLTRTYPTKTIAPSIAYSLLTQNINGKVPLPQIIAGHTIAPPKHSLTAPWMTSEEYLTNKDSYVPVFIIEEPPLHSKTRMKQLTNDAIASNAKIILITKDESNLAAADAFITETGSSDCEIAPISFSETAFFLERTFDMSSAEAEAVAIKLNETFRKFRLDTHPAYFAGIQEDVLASFVNANKRAELIQLAVDGLLTLVVAGDSTPVSLSRTTRERFLQRLARKINVDGELLDVVKITEMAQAFLREHAFAVSPRDFLEPFYRHGILYEAGGTTAFTHPYLENYLLAQDLRQNREVALRFFSPDADTFSFPAFDIYCELGPDIDVIEKIVAHAVQIETSSVAGLKEKNPYRQPANSLTKLSSSRQVSSLLDGLKRNTERLSKKDTSGQIRIEKQRALDAHDKATAGIRRLAPKASEPKTEELQAEFALLTRLSRSLMCLLLAVGSGAESLPGEMKDRLARHALALAPEFAGLWTQNRKRVDFDRIRQELTAELMNTELRDDERKEAVRMIDLVIYKMEHTLVTEPLIKVLWRISSTAGVKVLSPVLRSVQVDDPFEKVFRASWLMELEPDESKELLKSALSEFKGHTLLGIAVASHLMNRLYWHHFNTPASSAFVSAIQRALSPFGLKPSQKRLEQAKKGPEAST